MTPEPSSGVSALTATLTRLAAHARLLVIAPLAFAVLGIAAYLAFGRQYEAHSSFAPDASTSSLAGLASLAGQVGLSLPSLGEGPSLEFYVELLNSRRLLQSALERTYDAGDGQGERTLLEMWQIDPDAEDEVRAGVERLRDQIRVRALYEANVIAVTTTMDEPELAEQVNAALLQQLEDFNRNIRASKATQEAAFVEQRLEEVERDLRASERVMSDFLEANRTYETSPALRFEAMRLQREVDLWQELHASMAEAVEQARIEAVRNTPTITVIDRPDGSAAPSGSIAFAGVTGLLLGLLLALTVAASIEIVARLRESHPEDFARLRALPRVIRGRRS